MNGCGFVTKPLFLYHNHHAAFFFYELSVPLGLNLAGPASTLFMYNILFVQLKVFLSVHLTKCNS